MNKPATAIISLCAVWASSQAAQSQDDTQRPRSVAALPGIGAPHVVPRPIAPTGKLPSKRLLQQKALNAYPRTHFEKAQYFKKKGELDTALVEFLKTTQENPRMVKAFYEQALIFQKKGFLKLAESSLEQALAIKNDYQEARILLATISIQQGNVGAAVQELGKSLGLNLAPATGTASNTTAAAPAGKPAPAKPAAKGPRSANDMLSSIPSVLQSLHFTLAEVPANVPPASHPAPPQTGATTSGANSGGFALRHYPPVQKEPAPAHSSETTVKTASTAAAGSARSTSKKAFDSSPATKAETTAPNQSQEDADKSKNDDLIVLRIPRPFRFFFHRQGQSEHAGATPEKEPQTTAKAKVAQKEKDASDEPVAEKADKPVRPRAKSKSESDSKAKSVSEQPDTAKTEETHPAEKKSRSRGWFLRFLHGGQPQEPAGSTEPPTVVYAPPQERAAQDVQTVASVQPEAKSHTSRSFKVSKAAAPKSVEPAVEPTADKPSTSKAEQQPEGTLQGERAVALKFEPADPREAPRAPDKPAFQAPKLTTGDNSLLASIQPEAQAQPSAPPEDEWTTRLRYLAEHGTATLKNGEAFMFAEDTGEATLFLSDGTTIKRKIAGERDAQEIVRERRPDMLIPDDLVYNLSLLGKLIPKLDNSTPTPEVQPPRLGGSDQQPQLSPFNADDLTGDSQSFWGWLKHVFKL